jgi:hypothetical protein
LSRIFGGWCFRNKRSSTERGVINERSSGSDGKGSCQPNA